MPLRTSAAAWMESRQRISARGENIATDLEGGREIRSPQPIENKADVRGNLGKEKGLRECLSPYYWWRRGELNPRPRALYRQFYILSLVV